MIPIARPSFTEGEVVKQAAAGTLKGGESLCQPGAGKGYGVEKTTCDNPNEDNCEHE